MRKFIVLAATALFCVAMTANAASARGGGGHMGGGGGGHFGGGHFAGAHMSGMGGGWHGNWGGGHFVGHFGGFGHRAFFPRNRFVFRHRFHRFHDGFFFASIDDGYGCFIPRRVWTPWGWRWRRIWVCG